MATAFDMTQDNFPLGNVEAEAALCGALMLSANLIDPVADKLRSDDFSDPWMGNLFSLIVREHSLGHSATPVTLRPFYPPDQQAILAQLTGSGASIIAAKDCAEQIRDLAQRRRLGDGLREAMAAASSPTVVADDVAALAEAALAEFADRESGEAEFGAGECAKRALQALEDDNHGGVRSGFDALDAVWGPLRAKSLNIVAGRPGMGKSATALSYGIAAARHGHGVLFISLEMSADEIGERMLADICFDNERTRIPAAAISSGNLSNDQKRTLWRAQDMLSELPFAIVDTAGARVGKIDRIVRRYARRFAAKGQRLELVIIDYLGLCRPDRDRSKTYEEVSEISRALKEMAKRNEVAAMVLHQLSRDVERRGSKRPIMADLRDSGQIEQDADSILFLFAPEYYLAQEEPSDPAKHDEWQAEMDDSRGKLEFIIAKRRRGPAATGRGWFYRAYQAVRG